MLLPSYQWNPYQRLLAAALTAAGRRGHRGREWPRRTPILGAWLAQGRPDVVHHPLDPQLPRWAHGHAHAPQRALVRLAAAASSRLAACAWSGPSTTSRATKRATTRAMPRPTAAHRAGRRHHPALRHAPARRSSRCTGRARRRGRGMHVAAPRQLRAASTTSMPMRPRRGRALGLPAEGRVFAFVGSIRGYKNVAELLDAFSGAARARARRPAARLWQAAAQASSGGSWRTGRQTTRASCCASTASRTRSSADPARGDVAVTAVPRHPHLGQRHPGPEPRPAGHRAGHGLPARAPCRPTPPSSTTPMRPMGCATPSATAAGADLAPWA